MQYPAPISKGSEQPDEYPDESEYMEECGNCHRRFNLTSLAKHQKICEKVFSGPRKVFNMTAKRLEGIPDAEKVSKKAAGKGGSSGSVTASKKAVSAEEQPLKSNKADWKQKSSAFRDAMKASRDVTKALKEGRELPPPKPSAPDPSLIQCEYCSRRFNDKAAERHIAFCREKSQRDSMARGPPKKAPAPSTAAAKPTRGPVKKK
uniref:C2HC/C3H-type domain-containing protein n=1 Tax=Globisporangium ultimum (strain ATCC 200006 / CBS 805.95 / DAOM BR144) TaxID=431595 RepID=K3WYM0_GLOUD